MILIREKPFYRRLAALAIPITLQNVMNVLLGITDTVMLGRVSDSSEVLLSAANLANQPFFLIMLFVFGTMSGANVLISQYWGKKDTDTINSVVGIEFIGITAFGILATVLTVAASEPIMAIYSNEAEVVFLGAGYLKIIGASIIPSAFTNVLCGVLRGTEQVKLPLAANIVSIVLNIALNYILIFGKFGAPALGIYGAAYATVISRVAAMLIVLVYVIFFEKSVRLRFSRMLKIRRSLVRDFAKYSAPVVVNETVWALGINAHSAILGRLGTDEYAAYTIVNVIEQIVQLATMGFANAAAVIVGKQIGEFHVENVSYKRENPEIFAKGAGIFDKSGLSAPQKERIMTIGRTLILIAVASIFIGGGVVLLCEDLILGFYHVSALTIATAHELMIVMLVASLAKAFNSVNIVGLLRGAGSPSIGMYLDIGFMWVVSIPLGLLTAHLGFPFWAVYAFLMSDEILKVAFGIIYMNTRRWIKDIIRD